MGLLIPLVLLLGLIVVVVVMGIRRSNARSEEDGDGADLIPYLVLALSMGVAGFALAELAATAFPGESLVFDPAENLATSLSALVVSAPFVVYFWHRQSRRRLEHPRSPGWTLYLSIIELTFMTAFVVAAITFVNGLLTEDPASAWTRAVIFGGIVVFHELAARRTPPLSDAGELRRVIGSVIGLVPAAVGLASILTTLVAETDLFTDPIGASEYDPFLAMLLVGAPLWWYRWFSPWDAAPAAPRLTWAVIASVGSLGAALAAATAFAALVFEYVLTSTTSAGAHFGAVPVIFALVVTGLGIWWVHHRTLREVGGSSLAVYRYALATIGLVTTVTTAIFLTNMAFAPLIPRPPVGEIIKTTVILFSGIAVWLIFERRAKTDRGDTPAWPRSLYTLGVGITAALVAAGALITTLFILIRRLLEDGEGGFLLEPVSTLIYSGLAAGYLLSSYARERKTRLDTEVRVEPFQVTIICSHPGMIATKFPEQAKLRVLHRADDIGVIDGAMADAIVAAVDNRPAFVWVDETGFRVAPMRSQG